MNKNLNDKSFKRQMLEDGYFYEQLPPCFTTRCLAKKAEEVFGAVRGKKPVTAPVLVSMHKGDGTRRIISIPNPWSFARAVHVFGSNWTKCRQFAISENSQSKITFMHEYKDATGDKAVSEFINSESKRDRLGAISSFVRNLKERIIVSLGRPYKLSIDIAAFYDSIYTHSLAWSICGKDRAKWWYSVIANKEEGKYPGQEPKGYAQADAFDSAIRLMKSNETNGIVTGPFLSRIFSEMLLCGIDQILRKDAKYVFRRYVDDYSFYFHSESEAERGKLHAERIMHEFGLRLNASKTKIQRYPFDTSDGLLKRFNAAYESEGVYGLLNEASIVDQDGAKGAFKYALKMLNRKTDPEKQGEIDIPMLMNIGVSRPNCSILALRQIKKRESTLNVGQIALTLNGMIVEAVANGLDQEAINALYYCRELGIRVNAESAIQILQSGNDLCRIIMLDYIKNRRELLNCSEEDMGAIGRASFELSNALNGESVDGPHWLLIYESLNYGLLDISLGGGVTADLMRFLAELEVSFYDGFSTPDFTWATGRIEEPAI